MSDAVNLDDKFSLINDHWRPKVVAELNGQAVKLVKFEGAFPWHHHETEDEFFLVWKGAMAVEYRDRVVKLSEGEMCVVPRGVEHRTRAETEAQVLVFEPAATRNTGNNLHGSQRREDLARMPSPHQPCRPISHSAGGMDDNTSIALGDCGSFSFPALSHQLSTTAQSACSPEHDTSPSITAHEEHHSSHHHRHRPRH